MHAARRLPDLSLAFFFPDPSPLLARLHGSDAISWLPCSTRSLGDGYIFYSMPDRPPQRPTAVSLPSNQYSFILPSTIVSLLFSVFIISSFSINTHTSARFYSFPSLLVVELRRCILSPPPDCSLRTRPVVPSPPSL